MSNIITLPAQANFAQLADAIEAVQKMRPGKFVELNSADAVMVVAALRIAHGSTAPSRCPPPEVQHDRLRRGTLRRSAPKGPFDMTPNPHPETRS